MLRVRFHGRGGHGVKTASRILGSAAFLQGLSVQDSPVYGAERRGAAMAAFTRIDAEPILERGVMPDPDLVVIADETLLADAAAGALAGKEYCSAIFVNCATAGAARAAQFEIPCPVITLDVTALTHARLGRISALSAPLGAAACALAGFVQPESMARAVALELADLPLAPDKIEPNIALAREVFASVSAVEIRPAPRTAAAVPTHVPVHDPGPSGMPIIAAPGNSVARHTGSWRVFRPVIDLEACTRCGICFTYCPDGAIHLDAQGYPIIDYDHCKGCMMCYRECPIHCVREQKEVRAW